MVSCFVESTFFLIQISFLVVQYVFNLTDVISLSLNDLVANFYTEIWSYFHVVHFEAIAFKLMLFLKKNFLLGVTLLMSWSEKYFSGFFFSNLNNGYLWPPPRVWKRCMYRYNRPPTFPFPFIHYCPSMSFWNKCLSMLFSLFDLNLMNNFSLWKIGHLTLWKDDSTGAEMIFESLVKIKMMPEYLKIVIIKSLVKKK